MVRPAKYSAAQLATLSQLLLRMPDADVAREMGWTAGALRAQKARMGLHRPLSLTVLPRPVTLTPVEVAYLAGLIDGEGTVSVKLVGHRRTAWLSIANTSTELMDWLRATIPGPGAHMRAHRIRAEGRRQVFSFLIIGLGWLPLFEALEPLLIVKRPQMRLLIEFCRIRLSQHNKAPWTERQRRIVAEIRALNTRWSVRLADAPSSTSPSTT